MIAGSACHTRLVEQPGASSIPSNPLGAAARALFDLPDDVTYLNSAFMGPIPTHALEAGLMGLARKTRPWTIPLDDFTVPVDQLRGLFAELVGAPGDLDGIAITPSISYGVSTAAANLHLRAGQHVLVLEQQFPSDVYAWERLARRHGGDLVRVSRPDDGDWTAAVLAELDRQGDRIGLVSVPPCHWIDGGAVDLVAVGAAARRLGAFLAVDTCQSLGAVPFDVTEVQPDVVFGATYKWLCGPYSMGFLWAAPAHRDGEPIEHGWTGRSNSHCLACLADYVDDFQPGARRYDVGEVANFGLVPVALAGVGTVLDWDPARTAEHARSLTDRIAEGTRALGLHVAPDGTRSPHIIGVRLGPEVDAEAVAPRLGDEAVHVSVRGDAVRVSAHGFNTHDDVDRLLDALGGVLGRSR